MKDKLPIGRVCYKCGQFIEPASEEFIKAFETDGSKQNVDYIIEDCICEECEQYDRLYDDMVDTAMIEKFDFKRNDWKY